MRIVYCDDDNLQRELLSDMLMMHYRTHNNIRIETLSCAHHLAKLEGDIDLLISDGEMHTSTYEDSIRYQQQRFPDTPIVVYTGNEKLVEALKQKEIPVVMKSSSITELLLIIEKELGLRRK